jgi:hypothetical protein
MEPFYTVILTYMLAENVARMWSENLVLVLVKIVPNPLPP